MVDRTKTLIVILVAIIVVLIAVLVYVFVIQPQITGYTVERRTEGVQIALAEIVRVVSQCQTFPVTVGEGQTINLIALECLQAPQQPEPTQ